MDSQDSQSLSAISHRSSDRLTRTRPAVPLFISIAASLAVALVLAYAPVALARSSERSLTTGVAACSEAALRTALAGGGTVTFSVDSCTITVASSILITAPTTIDGSGRNIILSGGGARRIITTTPGVGTLALQSITLRDGTVLAGSVPDGSGGALMVRGNLILTNVTFLSNTANSDGGAVYATGAVTLSGGLFQNNTTNPSLGSGGGLLTGGVLAIKDTQFVNNSAVNGGAVRANSPAAVSGALFQNNYASNTSIGGGGLYAFAALAMTNTTFTSNQTAGSGGGVYAEQTTTINSSLFQSNSGMNSGGGAGALLAQSLLSLSGTQFVSNTTPGIGGAVWASNKAIVVNGLFLGNSATGMDGGGLSADGGAVVTGTRFIRNSAATGGALSLGASASSNSRIANVFLTGNTATGGAGSAIQYWDASHSLTVLHTTISSPTISAGSAIHSASGSVGITDTIITSAAVGIEQLAGSAYEDFNLFNDVTTPISGGVTSGAHHPSGSAAFVNPSSDDYHLGVPSAAIDAGVDAGVSQDFDGQLRPQGGGFDIGADESAFTVDLALAKTVTPAVAAPGDRVTFTLAYTQSGSGGIAYGVRITDQVPFSLTNLGFTSSGAAITATGGTAYAWQVANLPAGSGGVITLTGIVSPSLAGLPVLLTNTATITGNSGDNAPGNNTSSAAFNLIHAVITGLSAANSGPTFLGTTTALTATATGDNITYTWRFGDGPASSSSNPVTHTYASIGAYTATVTATNGISTVAATTNVLIRDVPISYSLANNSPTLFGHPTTLTLTLTSGTNVIYTWDFGDGSGGGGATVTHTYPRVGIFTATMTAMNSFNTVKTSTIVTISGYTLDLPLINR